MDGDRERERDRQRRKAKDEATPRRPEARPDQEAPGGQVTHPERKGSAEREPEEPHGGSEAV